jgi:hypothetical protein
MPLKTDNELIKDAIIPKVGHIFNRHNHGDGAMRRNFEAIAVVGQKNTSFPASYGPGLSSQVLTGTVERKRVIIGWTASRVAGSNHDRPVCGPGGAGHQGTPCQRTVNRRKQCLAYWEKLLLP